MISKKSQIAFIKNEAESCKTAYYSLQETFGTKQLQKIGMELHKRKQFYNAILQTLRKR